MSPPISVIVNYFNPTNNARIDAMTELALLSLQSFTSGELELILCDGSGARSDRISNLCKQWNWIYLPSSSPESFGASYNRGMRHASHYYRAWMANDIFVAPDWDLRLINELERTNATMACPYLSACDARSQIREYVFRRRTFVSSTMSFNLNVVTEKTINEVGYIDENFTGCFNDIDYLIRMRERGGFAIVADAGNVCHLSQATLLVSSLINYNNDLDLFRAKYASIKFGAWDSADTKSLVRSPIFYFIRNCTIRFPFHRTRRWMIEFVDRIEPLFHSI